MGGGRVVTTVSALGAPASPRYRRFGDVWCFALSDVWTFPGYKKIGARRGAKRIGHAALRQLRLGAAIGVCEILMIPLVKGSRFSCVA